MKDQTLQVLIVDDSEDDALLIIRELKKSGYNPFYYGKNSENISEKDILTNQANALKQQLDDINKRLSQIDSDK